jgi:DNA-binding transcriptional LysR family regulator
MSQPDLNLLVALDVLLAEGNVARAARRLSLSPSAMSRTLARLRDVTGDPLLVRAGRGLVPTPRAAQLRARVGQVVEDARAVLRPETALDLARLERTFTLRSSEGFAETFGPALIARAAVEAPGVTLRFVAKPDRESGPLREGAVDLETGVVGGAIGPEIRARGLFRDRFVAVVRLGHVLAYDETATSRYMEARHIVVSREGVDNGPVAQALAASGLARDVGAMVSGFSTAIALARGSDLVATVPDRHSRGLLSGTFTFPLPVPAPEIMISLLWHPRLDADPAHRWLRDCVQDVCGEP